MGRDVKQLDELQYKYDAIEKENRKLKAEVVVLKRIQNEQGRELVKAATETDYPVKIR